MLAVISMILIVLVAGSSVSSVVLTSFPGARTLRPALVAGGIGFLTSLLASVLLFLTTRAAMPMSPHAADQVLTPGILCSVIAPIIGVLTTKYARSRLKRGAIEVAPSG